MMRKLAAFALIAIAVPAVAQQAQPEPSMFLRFGLQVAGNLEQGRAGLVWDRAYAGFRASIPKERFIAEINQNNQACGKIVSRTWQSITLTRMRVSERQLAEKPLVVVTFANTTDRDITFLKSSSSRSSRTTSGAQQIIQTDRTGLLHASA